MAASVHRGSGYKSPAEHGRVRGGARRHRRVRRRRSPSRDVVMFTKNTTEAINRFARTMTLADDAVVLTTVLEHHSNLLPWRRRGERRPRPGPSRRIGGRGRPRRRAGTPRRSRRAARRDRRVERDRHRPGRAPDGREGARRRRADPRRRRPARRPPTASTCARTTTPATSTPSPCRRTRCTRRTAPGALIAGRDWIGADPDECGGGTVRAVTLDDGRVGRPARPGRGRQPEPAGGRRLRRRGTAGCGRSGWRSIAAHEQRLARLRSAGGWRRRARRDRSSVRPRPDLGVISLHASTAGTTGSSPPSSATSTASASAAAASAPSPTSTTCSASTGTPSPAGSPTPRRGDLRHAPGLVRISLGGVQRPRRRRPGRRRPGAARRRRRRRDRTGSSPTARTPRCGRPSRCDASARV